MNTNYLLTQQDDEVSLIPEHPDYSLIFIGGFSERDAHETPMRGYLSNSYLVNKSHCFFWPLFFYEPIRLAQDIEYEGYVAELGLIIIDDVTMGKMVAATKKLILSHYFEKQKIFTLDEIKTVYFQSSFPMSDPRITIESE